MNKYAFFTILFCTLSLSFTARAENCTDIIKLSLVNSKTVQNEKSFEEEARAFCDEYSKSSSKSKSGGGNVGYGGFTLGATSAKSNAQAIAERLCKSSDSSKLRDNAYEQYIQSIAPEAYDSYNHCKTSGQEVLINYISSTETEASIRVGFTKVSLGRSSGFIVDTTPEINCFWNNSEHPVNQELEIVAGSSKLLKCERSDSSKQGFINIIDEKSTDSSSYRSFPWTSYHNGIPVGLVASYNDAYQKLQQFNASLKEAVVYFNNDSCPEGWDKAPTTWGGRYVVISQENQKVGEVVGTALSVNENRATGKHIHVVPSAFRGGDCQDEGCATWGPKGGIKRNSSNTLDTLHNGDTTTVSTGTNAPYVALTGCIKN